MARSALLNVMVQAVFKAGKSLARDFGEVQNLQVSLKGPADYVSQADRKAERIIREELMKARPTYGFLGEEGEEIKGTDGAHRWIVDPLDGTTNFLHGIPHFAISVALERQGEIVGAVVFNPATDELYTAERGGGAFLNDRRLRVGARKALSDAVIGPARRISAAAITASIWSSCATSWVKSPAFAAWAPPRSTSLMLRLVASTASGNGTLPPGTWLPASCSSAKRVGGPPMPKAAANRWKRVRSSAATSISRRRFAR